MSEKSKHEHGTPVPSHETLAEQTREANEAAAAKAAGESAREHMVDIGRGNQQAGRQGHVKPEQRKP